MKKKIYKFKNVKPKRPDNNLQITEKTEGYFGQKMEQFRSANKLMHDTFKAVNDELRALGLDPETITFTIQPIEDTSC